LASRFVLGPVIEVDGVQEMILSELDGTLPSLLQDEWNIHTHQLVGSRGDFSFSQSLRLQLFL
jgi:hypothetical protein